MADAERASGHERSDGFDRGFEGHQRRQARLGLRLSPVERLRWLEETMDALRRLRGRAGRGRPIEQKAD
jgi:hypothetical protein